MNDESIVRSFNAYINEQNIEGLSGLMTVDHKFVDSSGQIQSGKDLMIKVWQGFFDSFADYQNHFTRIISRGDCVIVLGHSTCSFEPLDGLCIWKAVVRDGLVAEWHVFDDTAENRKMLNLSTQQTA